MLEIRRATRADAEVAYRVRRLAVLDQCSDHYVLDDLLLWTAGNAEDGYAALMDGHFYLGWIDGEAVVTGMLDLAGAEVGALFVHPDHLRHGLGRQMLKFLEALASDLQLAELRLDATLNAAAFYRHCGYVDEGLALYHSPRGLTLECVSMSKRLVP